VEDDSGFAVRIAAGLPVHKVPVADIEHAVVVWFDLWVKLCHIFPVNVVGQLCSLCSADSYCSDAQRRGERRAKRVRSTARLCTPSRRPTRLVASNDSGESPQGLIGLPWPGEDGSDVRVERHNEAALCIVRRILVRPRAGEVVLGKDFVNSNPPLRSGLLRLGLPHILVAHGALPSAR